MLKFFMTRYLQCCFNLWSSNLYKQIVERDWKLIASNLSKTIFCTMDFKPFKLDIDELINDFAKVRFSELTSSFFFLVFSLFSYCCFSLFWCISRFPYWILIIIGWLDNLSRNEESMAFEKVLLHFWSHPFRKSGLFYAVIVCPHCRYVL